MEELRILILNVEEILSKLKMSTCKMRVFCRSLLVEARAMWQDFSLRAKRRRSSSEKEWQVLLEETKKQESQKDFELYKQQLTKFDGCSQPRHQEEVRIPVSCTPYEELERS